MKRAGPCREAGPTWASPRPRPRPARPSKSRATGKPVKLLAAYDRDRRGHPPIAYHVYKLVYLCEILDHEPLSDVDTDGARFFGEQEIPELSVTRVTRAQIYVSSTNTATRTSPPTSTKQQVS